MLIQLVKCDSIGKLAMSLETGDMIGEMVLLLQKWLHHWKNDDVIRKMATSLEKWCSYWKHVFRKLRGHWKRSDIIEKMVTSLISSRKCNLLRNYLWLELDFLLKLAISD